MASYGIVYYKTPRVGEVPISMPFWHARDASAETAKII